MTPRKPKPPKRAKAPIAKAPEMATAQIRCICGIWTDVPMLRPTLDGFVVFGADCSECARTLRLHVQGAP